MVVQKLVFGNMKMSRKFKGYHPTKQFSTGTLILEFGKLVQPYMPAAALQQPTIIRMTSSHFR